MFLSTWNQPEVIQRKLIWDKGKAGEEIRVGDNFVRAILRNVIEFVLIPHLPRLCLFAWIMTFTVWSFQDREQCGERVMIAHYGNVTITSHDNAVTTLPASDDRCHFQSLWTQPHQRVVEWIQHNTGAVLYMIVYISLWTLKTARANVQFGI